MTASRARTTEATPSIAAERDRLVSLLKHCAARIDAAPLDLLADVLPTLALPANELGQSVDGLLPMTEREAKATPVCVPGKGPTPCC